MKKVEKVTQYVRKLFSRYGMSAYVDEPLFLSGRIEKDVLSRAAEMMGITVEEILSLDKDAATRYWNKYRFCELYEKYKVECKWNNEYKNPRPSVEELLIKAIFGDDNAIKNTPRFDMEAVLARCHRKIREYDRALEGSRHDDAEITNLHLTTQVAFSFPECAEMISSFLTMTEQIQKLFFKALKSELNNEEINELNFLANYLRAVDIVSPSTIITYSNVMKYREIYLAENYPDFYKYVKFKSGLLFSEPWRCKEFFDDESLVQRFVYVFPQAKSMMREFGMELSNFVCDFIWSDAEPMPYYEGEEVAEKYLQQWIEPTPFEERPKVRTRVYVEKEPDELEGLENYISLLKKTYGPVTRGGVSVPAGREFELNHEGIERMEKRAAVNVRGRING